MLKSTKTIQIQGQSLITIEGGIDKTAVSMYATINDNGKFTLNESIADAELYRNNIDTCQEDMLAFHKEVLAITMESEE